MNVLINHPKFGSFWLLDAEIKNNNVVGNVFDTTDIGSSYLPDDYNGELITMNFPITCIRKTEE